MGAQQYIRVGLDEESILHVAGRMVFGQVQGGKVVPVVFDLGPFRNSEANARKDIDDPVFDNRDRVFRTQLKGFSRPGEIAKARFGRLPGLQGSPEGFYLLGCCVFELIHRKPERLFLRGRHLFQGGEIGIEQPFLAEVLDPELFQGLLRIGLEGPYLFQVFFQLVDHLA